MQELVSAYNLFVDRIDEIVGFIDNMHSGNEVWESFEQFTLSEEQHSLLEYMKSSVKKTIQYNAIIISLYGCFENYIDSVFSRFLDIVFAGTSTYDSLSKGIREKYKTKLTEYLSSPARFYGIEIPTIKLLDDYIKVLKSDFVETVNKEFLLMHSGNLRLEQIVNLMHELGIEEPKKKIYNSTLFRRFYIETVGLDKEDYELKVRRDTQDLCKYLDDLVLQRNIVAHGWAKENIISNNDILNYHIPFMVTLAEVLLRILICESVVYVLRVKEPVGIQKESIAVYDNRIVCLHICGQAISVGDYIVYRSDTGYKCAKIKCIQINNQDYQDISDVENDVGLELDDRIAQKDQICCFVSQTH